MEVNRHSSPVCFKSWQRHCRAPCDTECWGADGGFNIQSPSPNHVWAVSCAKVARFSLSRESYAITISNDRHYEYANRRVPTPLLYFMPGNTVLSQ
jgi:hypothetical protein